MVEFAYSLKNDFKLLDGFNQPKAHVTILINKETVDEVKHIKYLGILIDSQSTFKYHLDELNKKVSRAIGILYKLRPFVTLKILCNIYYICHYLPISVIRNCDLGKH